MKKNKDTFNFEEEIVIGVSKQDEKPKKNIKKNKKKKRKKSTIVIKIVAIVLIFIAITIFALVAPIFNIVDIQVQGNNTISAETIVSLSEIKKGQNIFRFNNNIKNKIKENSYIENVEIKRKLPGTVIITVVEREIKYQINLVNSYSYIDVNGYLLENSSEKKDVPVIVGLKITEEEILNSKRLGNKDLEKLNDILKIMNSAKSSEIDSIITEINVDENNYILLIESKQKTVYLGNIDNLANKMLYIKKILENEEGKTGKIFVNGDIGAGFKPYFREE